MAKTLEQRVRELEDRERIKELRHLYCYYADQGRLGECADLFTRDDPVAEFEPLGTFRGWEAVRKFYTEVVPKMLPYMLHFVHNHTIELRGDWASGQCYFEFKGTSASGEAWIGAGWYEDDLVRVGEGWKFKRRKANFSFFLPASVGWAVPDKVRLSAR
jgi:hypothetical protein